MKTAEENGIKSRYYSIQQTTEYESGSLNVAYISEEEYLKQKLAEVMPEGKKPVNRKELSLWNYWDATSSEQRVDIVKRAFRLIEAQNKYIELLGEELDELAVLAHNRGWRSKRAEQGKKMREQIDLLTNKTQEDK